MITLTAGIFRIIFNAGKVEEKEIPSRYTLYDVI